jgi:hypothetical protein
VRLIRNQNTVPWHCAARGRRTGRERRSILGLSLCAVAAALVAACIAVPCHAADFSDFVSLNDPSDGASRQNSLFVFYGRMSTTNLGSTLFFNSVPLFTDAITGQKYDNFIAGAAYQRDFYRIDGFVIAAEIGIADRFGHYIDCCEPSSPTVYTSTIVNSGELWLGPAFRYESIVLFNELRVIPGFTVGFSAVTNSIGTELDREQSENGNATLLGYLGVEVAFSLMNFPALEFVIREHHRSGMNKLLGNMMEGYNANVAGFRYRF